MLHFCRFAAVLLLPVLHSVILPAQTTDADIRPMLKSMMPAQKLQLLEYLRYLGADLDSEIQHSYEKVSRRDQFKTVQFIKSLKQGNKTSALTAASWDRDTLFLGEIVEGSLFIDSFVVTNNGSAPYLITGFKTTCDCTILRSPTHPLMPGESAIVRIEFDSREKLGVTSPAIIIFDNSTPNKRQILYLHGTVSARKKLRKYPWED